MSRSDLARGAPRPPGGVSRVSSLALILLAVTAPGSSQAQLFAFDDRFTFTTTGQSLFSSGGTQGWAYDSGLLGSGWGTYTGNPARSFGINAISGSEREEIFPAIPGIPAQFIKVCDPLFGTGCKTIQVFPEIPGTPAVYADTRTGASAKFSSSGEVGIRVKAQSSGGSLSATLPFETQVRMTSIVSHYTEPPTFRIGGSSALGQGASFAASGLAIAVDVSATLNMRNSLSATGCAIGAGCSTSSMSLNVIAGTFGVVGIDTARDEFLSVAKTPIPGVEFDRDYEVRRAADKSVSPVVVCAKGATLCSSDREGLLRPAGPNLVTFNASALDDHATTRFGDDTLRLSSKERVLTTQLDITGVGQLLGGLPVDVLNPNVTLGGVAAFSGSLVQAQVGIEQSFVQKLELTARPSVALTFDEDVFVYHLTAGGVTLPAIATNGGAREPDWGLPPGTYGVGQSWVNVGRTVTLDLERDIYVRFADGTPGRLLERRYFIGDDADFTTEFLLDIDPILSTRGGCGKITLLFGLGATGQECTFDEQVTIDGASVRVYRKSFDLGGFGDQTIVSDPVSVGDGDPEPDPDPTPDPDPLPCLSCGLGGDILDPTGGILFGQGIPTSIVVPAPPVPEPTSAALMLAGLVALVGVRRHRRAGRRQEQPRGPASNATRR